MSLVGLYAALTRRRENEANRQIVQLTAFLGVAQILLAMTMKGWLDLRYLGGCFSVFFICSADSGFGFWRRGAEAG